MVGDADGVVVVPGEHLDGVLDAAAARTEKEAGLFEALRAGTATTLTLLGLDPSAVRSGTTRLTCGASPPTTRPGCTPR